MNELKLLYDNQIFAMQRFGGASRLFFELISHLSQKPFIRLSFTPGFYINDFPLPKVIPNYNPFLNFKVPCFPYVSTLLKPLNNAIFHLYTSGKPVDLYHPTQYSLRVANWRKSPIIITVYDLIPEMFPGYFPDIKARLLKRKSCISRADHIIAISNTTKNDLINFYNVPDSKVTVIYPGAPVSPFSQHSSLPSLPYIHRKPFILYVGTRKQNYKNVSNILKGYSAASRVKAAFDFIFFGGPEFTQEERNQIASLNCSDQVFHFSGNDRFLASFYNGASAFVYPSLYEGFGLPPLEAMVYGCPVISAPASAMKEILGDSAAYFSDFTAEAISASLETFLFDSPLLSSLKTKGYERIKKYSWKDFSNQTLSLYQELTQKQFPPITNTP